MSTLRLVDRLDHNFVVDTSDLADSRARRSMPAGAYAACTRVHDDVFLLERDPLGLNRVFWARDTDGGILVAARPHRLIERGVHLGDIAALPPGSRCVVDFARMHSSALACRTPERPRDGIALTPAQLALRIRTTLHRYLAGIAGQYRQPRAVVCLSGGLDSAGILVLAREHFESVLAVSFCLRSKGGEYSDDRRAAARLAAACGVDLLEIDVTRDELLSQLDRVLLETADWRAFNVHAALVNMCIASYLRERAVAGPDTIVCTGDLMNEFVVDYEAEHYGGEMHYRLPRLPKSSLRQILIRGLESCHREIGAFEAEGLAVVQPYAAAWESYASIPESFLNDAQCKAQLARKVFGHAIPQFIFDRPKTRAQIGGADSSRGVLAACIDSGIDDKWLRARFAELHGCRDQSAMNRFMVAGRHRTLVPHPEETQSAA